MDRSQLIQKIQGINVWKRGGQRAPHKPLLLLYALGACSRGEERLIPYSRVDPALRTLLAEFGPTRKVYHPEYPFWRLRNDDVWTLSSTEGLQRRRSNSDPTKTSLLEHDVAGGFTAPIYDLLRNDSTFIAELAAVILDAHFPASLHEDLLDAVGLTVQGEVNLRRKRDPEFRRRILRAYEYRCAVCGFDVRMDNQTIGLEAAHVKWHQAGGPDTEANGLALCAVHHKLFDRGAFQVTPAYRFLVSERVHGTQGLLEWLLRYHNKPVRRPQHHRYTLEPEFITWHVSEVFKGPARATS